MDAAWLRTPAEVAAEDARLRRADPQNVHDHGVVAATKANLAAAAPRAGAPDVAAIREALVRRAQERPTAADELARALEVLDSLRGDRVNGVFDVSEQQALRSVWDKIEVWPTQDDRGPRPTNDADPGARSRPSREQLVDLLLGQLASGVERGSVVCSTGKIARIVGTFDGVDPDARPAAPMWALKEEMAATAAAVREEHLARLSARRREAYETGQTEDEEDESAIAFPIGGGDDGDDDDDERIAEGMRRDFGARMMRLYRDELGMSESVLGPLVEQFAAGF